jgi:P27 family predicted phage terminase small subunit
MGARGPAPKPTALKRLGGNAGKRKPSAKEPRPRSKKPKMPGHFTPDISEDDANKEWAIWQREFYEIARAEWRRVVRELSAVPGLLTSVDSDALAMYCETYARWVQASAKLAQGGMVEKLKTKTGSEYYAISPYMTIVSQCMATMKQFLSEFGMTPASRTRIQVQQETDTDEFDEYLHRRSSG